MPGFVKETADPNDSNEKIGKRRKKLDSMPKSHNKRIEKKF